MKIADNAVLGMLVAYAFTVAFAMGQNQSVRSVTDCHPIRFECKIPPARANHAHNNVQQNYTLRVAAMA